MGAIFKKEIKTLFLTPIGWVVIALYNCLAGIMFVFTVLNNQTSDVKSFFGSLILIILMSVSVLSMKFFSEERKTKTDQLLLTSPVSLSGIVLGKFFAAMIVYMSALLVSIIYIIIIAILGTPEMGVVFGNYLGLTLVGGALIAVGLFISSLTQSQVISAVLTFSIFIVMLLSGALVDMIKNLIVGMNETLKTIITSIADTFAIYDKFTQFTSGMLDISAIVYYLSMIAIFLFLTVRVLEKRRWS